MAGDLLALAFEETLSSSEHTARYLTEVARIAAALDARQIDSIVHAIAKARDAGGRLFFLGVGGGAGHASHAASDFRKIAGIESYSASDNVSELTARINDDGWESSYVDWLRGSRLNQKDAVFIFSVGGGNVERGISVNLVRCIDYAKELGAAILGIVGRDGGYAAKMGGEVIVVPTEAPDTVTPQTEGFQAVLWHCIVSHPVLQRNPMKWESAT